MLRIETNAQTALDTASAAPSAALDLSSTSRGIQIPGMAAAQRNAVKDPASGLQIYDTDTKSVWHYAGSHWIDAALAGIYKGSARLNGNTTVGEAKYPPAITH